MVMHNVMVIHKCCMSKNSFLDSSYNRTSLNYVKGLVFPQGINRKKIKIQTYKVQEKQ